MAKGASIQYAACPITWNVLMNAARFVSCTPSGAGVQTGMGPCKATKVIVSVWLTQQKWRFMLRRNKLNTFTSASQSWNTVLKSMECSGKG